MDNALVLHFVCVSQAKPGKDTKSLCFRGENMLVDTDIPGVQNVKTKSYFLSIPADADAEKITASLTNSDGTKKSHTFSPEKYETSELSETASMIFVK